MKKGWVFGMVLGLLLLLMGCSRGLTEEEVINRARRDIPISEIEEMEIQLLGKTEKEGKALFWLKTGNESQTHAYFPVEVELTEGGYRFEKVHNAMERGPDLYAFLWGEDYVFMVDNPDCRYLICCDWEGNIQRLEITQMPFLYQTDGIPSDYGFFDANDEEM